MTQEIKIGPIEHERGNYYISNIPPEAVYDEAVEKFGIDFYGYPVSTIFTFGDTIHVASGVLENDILEHELTHVKQQTEYPGGALAWWKKYFIDQDFRFSQELEAYRIQYKVICEETTDRNRRFVRLHFLTKCLTKVDGEKRDLSELRKLIEG